MAFGLVVVVLDDWVIRILALADIRNSVVEMGIFQFGIFTGDSFEFLYSPWLEVETVEQSFPVISFGNLAAIKNFLLSSMSSLAGFLAAIILKSK